MRRALSVGDRALLAVLIIMGDGLKAGSMGIAGSVGSMRKAGAMFMGIGDASDYAMGGAAAGMRIRVAWPIVGGCM
jgi:hypothetical protein